MNKFWTPLQNKIYDSAPQHGDCSCSDCKTYWRDFPSHPWYAQVFRPYNHNDDRPF